MEVRRPGDLPEFRMWLLDQWRPGAEFDLLARVSLPHTLELGGTFGGLEPRFDRTALAKAKLWWVSADMARLVARASKNLPPTTLTDDLVRDDCAMVFLEEPLSGTDTKLEDPIQVRMLLWDEHTKHRNGRRYLTTAMYADRLPGNDETYWNPLGRTDWEFGVDTDEPIDERLAHRKQMMDSQAEDRRWVATLLLLASQPVSESRVVRQTNKSKIRRLAKSGLSTDVRFVDLRKSERQASSSGEGRPVEWSHRWIVGEDTGGFWRQQAYGPERSLRRPKWIMPFIKGPEDKPLKTKDTVRILKGER